MWNDVNFTQVGTTWSALPNNVLVVMIHSKVIQFMYIIGKLAVRCRSLVHLD